MPPSDRRYRLLLSPALTAEVVAHARREWPLECCGLIAGRIDEGVGLAEVVLPLVNELASAVAYRSEPRSVLAAERAMRAAGLARVAVYHSHPSSAAVPSARDRAECFDADVVQVIVGFVDGAVEVRAWWID